VPAHVVATDNLLGAYQATEHLYNLGHRRIGLALESRETVTSSVARIEGYKAALHDYGVPFDDDLVLYASVRPETVRTYLQRATGVTAMFVVNDDCAMALMQILPDFGLHVPDQMAIVGFDDVPMAAHVDPPLTTVAQNTFQLGTAAAHLIADSIEGRVTSPATIVIPPELVIRESCGAQRAGVGSKLPGTEFREDISS
jgi:LacI family transcriptional regulator